MWLVFPPEASRREFLNLLVQVGQSSEGFRLPDIQIAVCCKWSGLLTIFRDPKSRLGNVGSEEYTYKSHSAGTPTVDQNITKDQKWQPKARGASLRICQQQGCPQIQAGAGRCSAAGSFEKVFLACWSLAGVLAGPPVGQRC